MIEDEAYKELEEAVGVENVSREPAVLDGYAWQPCFNDNPDIWISRPEAVVLPASTEEVQAVVRACGRHGLKFKAFSTGWASWAGPSEEGVVQVDLRRMDRILEIDEKNMIAVVEPYAIGGQIRAEAMRFGLNTHMIAAGAGVSPLASACAAFGPGWDGTYSPRNLMGVEWVLPDGEVLRLGTPGSGQGWFCADGPGPSLRGIMRGKSGALGGNGIFTKCALKLFNWPGAPKTDLEGIFFDIQLEIPENCKIYMIIFPDRKRWAEASYSICLEGVDYTVMKSPVGVMPVIVAPRLMKKVKDLPHLREMVMAIQHSTMLTLAAHSERELEFQDAVVRKIVSENDGLVLDLGATPFGGTAWWMVISGAVPPMAFRAGGQMQTGLGPNDTWDTAVGWDESGEKIKKDWIEKDCCIDDLSDACIDMLWEDGSLNHSEELWYYNPRDRKQMEAIRLISFDFFLNAMERCTDQPWAVQPHLRKLFGPLQGNYNLWQRKIQESFDPGGAADSTLYTSEADLNTSGIDPGKLEKLKKLIADRRWMK